MLVHGNYLRQLWNKKLQVISQRNLKLYTVRIEFNPTVPHCSLATLIGLSIRIKVVRSILENVKLDIYIKEGAHTTEEESNNILINFFLTINVLNY